MLATTQKERSIRHLTGWERFTLYSVAIGTGFRASELASLTPAHFDLTEWNSESQPCESTPLTRKPDVATRSRCRQNWSPSCVRGWQNSLRRPDCGPANGLHSTKAAKLIEYDLRKARAAWIKEAESDDEREARERSGFLSYNTEDGTADFHSLRHTYLSRLGRSGASAKAMQKLARHTTVELTIGRYTHANLYDLAAAVDGLPPLLPVPESDQPEADSVALRATGTTDADNWTTTRPDSESASVQKPQNPVSNSEGSSKPSNLVGRMVGQKVGQPPDSDRPRLRLIEAPDASEPTSETADSARQNPLQGNGFESSSESLTAAENEKREWMGIEPTRPLFRGLAGFEARGSHQIYKHSRSWKPLLSQIMRSPQYLWIRGSLLCPNGDTN